MVAGLLLTGGASRRLGHDKATLRLDGETLAARAAAALTARCAPVLEVGPGRTALPTIREDPPGSGPLSALAAGIAELGAAGPLDAVLLVGCDLPHVGPALDALVAAPPAALVVPVDANGRHQYVCARYGSELLEQAAGLVAAGERSLRALAALAPAGRVIELTGLPAEVLADVDTAADARALGVELPR